MRYDLSRAVLSQLKRDHRNRSPFCLRSSWIIEPDSVHALLATNIPHHELVKSGCHGSRDPHDLAIKVLGMNQNVTYLGIDSLRTCRNRSRKKTYNHDENSFHWFAPNEKANYSNASRRLDEFSAVFVLSAV